MDPNGKQVIATVIIIPIIVVILLAF